MKKKKRGFFLFCFSLIPGAGEMYMGFYKKGISIMVLFFGILACASLLDIGPLLFTMPILWFYSFFYVHNLKSLSDEEFYSVEDDYIYAFKDKKIEEIFSGYERRKWLAIILMVIGVCTLFDVFDDFLWNFLHYYFGDYITYTVRNGVPKCAIAILMIALGIKMIRGKKRQLDAEEENNKTED